MKKSILKKIISICLILAMLFVTGCSTEKKEQAQNTDSKKKITVLLPAPYQSIVGFIEKETREFEKETGIEVELIHMAWDQVADRAINELTTGGSTYDVIEFDNAWVAKFIKNNWVECLDDYVSDETRKELIPGLREKFSNDGKLYGIPWHNDTRFFMYNKKMLDQAGISELPKTWAELEEQSKLLKEKGLAKYGYIDSYMQAQSGSNQIIFLTYAFGGKFFDDKGQPIMATDPGVKKAFEFMVRGLNDSKIIDPSSLTADYESVSNVFNMGNTAFYLQAHPNSYQLANNKENSKIVGDIAVADYSPSVQGGEQVCLTLPEAMAIPKTSKSKEEAWKYIEYMTSKALDKKRAKEIGTLPMYTELFNDKELLDLYPHWKSFGKQIVSSRGLPDLLWYDEFSNILSTEAQKILLKEISIEEGLQEIQDKCMKAMK
ncbi:MAG: extracellular solute-binding protein [Marinisporobacter sp.]|jgi:multiple sugar transport system substrate-binding protein|nr:extracellular solute-binding protein [Marinisporobacter sp.]